MKLSRHAHRLGLLFALLAPPAAGCARPDDASITSSAIGADFEEFPSHEAVLSAMDAFDTDPASARAGDPMNLSNFFGEPIKTLNSQGDDMLIELVWADRSLADKPVALLHARFGTSAINWIGRSFDESTWNNRFRDVQLFNLADSTGTVENPFPEARAIPTENGPDKFGVLIRVWSDFRVLKKGAPGDLQGPELRAEVARMAVWSYVTGNIDGPAVNNGNAGFAKFLDESGRSFWRGVLIDGGAAWNEPGTQYEPWHTNILGLGPVAANDIPQQVRDSIAQIAGDTADDLATRAGLDPSNAADQHAMSSMSARAQKVCNYYGIAWQ